jgi:hypothetical protein
MVDKIAQIIHARLPAQVRLNLKCLPRHQEEKDGAEKAIEDHALLERSQDRQ